MTQTDTKDREIIITRIIDAPRERVFQAFRDPQQIEYWWGPRGFTNTIHGMDFREGGVWTYTMHGPDGIDYPNRVEYKEIRDNERITYMHGDSEMHDMMLTTITFTPKGDKTEVELHMVTKTAAEIENMKKFGAVQGGEQTLTRLDEHMAKTPEQAAEEFFIARVFDASRDLVWKAFSEKDALAQWWGPKGFEIDVKRLEFKPGGVFHYSMQQGSETMWGRFTYKEIEAPTRLVFINSFSDDKGDIARAPFFEGQWPLEVLNQLILVELNGKTILELRCRPINAGPEEHEKFFGAHRSMHEGFSGTWEQLAAYLAKGKSQ